MPPEKMTRAEYEKKYGVPPPVKMTRAEFAAKYGYDPKTPSWGQSARFVGKSLLESPMKLLDLPISLLTGKTPFLDAEHQLVGSVADEHVGGKVADYVQSGLGAAALPFGGVAANLAGGIGSQFAKEHGLPEWLGGLVGSLGAGAAGSLVKSVARNGKDTSERLFASVLGATKSDYNNAKRAAGIVYDAAGNPETSLRQTIRNIRGRGFFNDKNVLDAHSLHNANEVIKQNYEKELTQILDTADKARIGKLNQVSQATAAAKQEAERWKAVAAKIQTGRNIAKAQATASNYRKLAYQQRRLAGPRITSFPIARGYIKSGGNLNNPELTQAFDETINRLKSSTTNDISTVAGLQAEKRAFYQKAYGETGKARDDIKTYLAADIKNSIENHVDDLAKQGLVPPELAGRVKELNKQYGEHLSLGKILEKAIPTADAEVPGGWIAQLTKTTPGNAAGVAAPTIAGAAAGGLPGAAIGAASGIAALATMSNPGKLARSIANDAAANALNAPIIAGKAATDFLPSIGEDGVASILQSLSGLYGNESDVAQSPVAKLIANYSESPAYGMENKPSLLDQFMPQDKSISDTLTAQDLANAVIHRESSGRADAFSSAGASGLMQLEPGTASDVAAKLGLTNYDINDPATNIKLGTTYLQQMLDQFKDPELALTAYNQGPGRVQKLLDQTGGSTLDDILPYLGHDGKSYANNVLESFQNGTPDYVSQYIPPEITPQPVVDGTTDLGAISPGNLYPTREDYLANEGE